MFLLKIKIHILKSHLKILATTVRAKTPSNKGNSVYSSYNKMQATISSWTAQGSFYFAQINITILASTKAGRVFFQFLKKTRTKAFLIFGKTKKQYLFTYRLFGIERRSGRV